METQMKAFYQTPEGLKFVTIFGYCSRSIPSLEINGVGKFSKNIKEKLIFVTKARRLVIPQRRFVICVEMDELNSKTSHMYKWLEFPLLLMYWYLSGLIPISHLDDCLSSGLVMSHGEIVIPAQNKELPMLAKQEFESQNIDSIKLIGNSGLLQGPLWQIDAKLLLEHIPNLKFRTI